MLLYVLHLATLLVNVFCSTYYIGSDVSDFPCTATNGSCLTLSEVVAAVASIDADPDLNVSLIMSPGNHSLNSSSTVSGFHSFSIATEDKGAYAIINCEPSSSFHFHFMMKVHIRGVAFKGCVDSEVKSVREMVIKKSTFTGNTNGRALLVTNSTVIFLNSSFTYFRSQKPQPAKNAYGGAI